MHKFKKDRSNVIYVQHLSAPPYLLSTLGLTWPTSVAGNQRLYKLPRNVDTVGLPLEKTYISLEPFGLSLFGFRTILHVWSFLGFYWIFFFHLGTTCMLNLIGQLKVLHGKSWDESGKLGKVNQTASHYCCQYLDGFLWNYGWYLWKLLVIRT